jgi:hypothetical protein
MPTTNELVNKIGDVLARAGVNYRSVGARDKHYAIWMFAMILDEASRLGGACLRGVQPGPEAVFRGNPSDLDEPPSYTRGWVRGALRDWEVHVDVNILGTSGATHGVDVSMVPLAAMRRVWQRGGAPSLHGRGLGIEAKCFTKPLTPNEGRVTLGFQQEMRSDFWLAANHNNDAVQTMLGLPGRRTAFFPDLKPGAPSETEFRVAVRAQLQR